MQLNGTTKILGIFGDPIAHTLSPKMQNAAIAAAGINAVFVPFHVKEDVLPGAVAAIRSLGLVGVNVTVPHKESIIPYLDEIDSEAKLIGAVNTVVNLDGRLIGHNTDGRGFLNSLHSELSFLPAGKNVLLLGAGGAARAAIVALAQADVGRIVISNRTYGKAEELVKEFSGHFPDTELIAEPFATEKLQSHLASVDLLVNTTVVGLQGEDFSLPLIETLSAKAVFYDMVYAPVLTPLQQAANDRGLQFADGRGMLAGQGEVAFELWFGTRPASDIMRSVIAK